MSADWPCQGCSALAESFGASFAAGTQPSNSRVVAQHCLAVLRVQVGSARSASANLALWGCFVYLAFVGSFGFYAYARIAHTVSGHRSVGIVIYEIIVLLAELLIFLSGAQYGLIHVRLAALSQEAVERAQVSHAEATVLLTATHAGSHACWPICCVIQAPEWLCQLLLGLLLP